MQRGIKVGIILLMILIKILMVFFSIRDKCDGNGQIIEKSYQWVDNPKY